MSDSQKKYISLVFFCFPGGTPAKKIVKKVWHFTHSCLLLWFSLVNKDFAFGGFWAADHKSP